MAEENKMKGISIDKVVVNMGVGQTGEELKKAQQIMEKITGMKSVQTKCKVKQPTWDIRPGLPIGCMVTLRGEKAVDFLKNALSAKDNELKNKNFDKNGNFGFGVKEYIDMPKTKYDPKLGIRGFDVLVSLKRPGYRVAKRKQKKAKIGKKHIVSKEEAIEFVQKEFGVVVK